jgi:Ca2+-binding RTX toxin-like protein
MAIIVGTTGPDTLEGTGQPDFIKGKGGDDTLLGLGERDDLRGGFGDDTLFGGNGKDTLLGDAGDDFLFGGAADDTLIGGKGADFLDGGQGDDELTGSGGSDTFLIQSVDGGSTDTIRDFNPNQDTLQQESNVDHIFMRDVDKDGDKDTVVVLEDGDRYQFIDQPRQVIDDFLV